MRRSSCENKLTEIFVHRNEDSFFPCSPFKDCSVTRVGTSISGFDNIMALLTQPLGQSMTSAGVNKEPHFPATPTASNESWVITACAYARQARISSDSRSG